LLRILDRYILREVVVSWLAVTGVLLAILLTDQVARVLERAAEGQFPRGVVIELIMLGAVQNVPLVLPVGLLLGIVLALGRLYHDSEMTAAQACGAGSRSVMLPVLGFTLLQEHTEDDMRGRIFATLLTVVRLSVLLALLLGPFLATVFNGFARSATGDPADEVPTVSALGFDLAIPGVRLTLWLAALIIIGAGVLSARSMKMGLRDGILSGTGPRRRSRHIVAYCDGGLLGFCHVSAPPRNWS
jgi:hypothetical protein